MYKKVKEEILSKNIDDICFIVGNGINRFSQKNSSWERLLYDLWKNVMVNSIEILNKKGISFTEIYDIIELNNKNNKTPLKLQKEFCILMDKWEPNQQHRDFIHFAKTKNTPVLTTNFDELLKKADNLSFYRISKKGFTDYYPWDCYYGKDELKSPIEGFGVWHINGMQKYFRSIRLGLTHYMGSVERARNMIHKGKEDRLFTGKNNCNWKGSKTWLHIIFNKSIFIFGLGLNRDEIFLRWLLLERAIYFKKFPERKKLGWYLHRKEDGDIDKGKKIFLQEIGIKVIELPEKDIYINLWKL